MSMSRIQCCVWVSALAAFLLVFTPQAASGQAQLVLKRGDANLDTRVDIADPIFLLSYIFTGGPAPRCLPTAKANPDNRLDISDAIFLLTYLFTGGVTLLPLTDQERAECENPLPPTVLRDGRFQNVAEPDHGVSGLAEELSDRTIRLTNFYFDGLGVPRVVVYLQEEWFRDAGWTISPDLLRDTPYQGENFVFPIPPEVTSDQFKYVTIYCDFFPQVYAYARLTAP